jgi:hypothetical protein
MSCLFTLCLLYRNILRSNFSSIAWIKNLTKVWEITPIKFMGIFIFLGWWKLLLPSGIRSGLSGNKGGLATCRNLQPPSTVSKPTQTGVWSVMSHSFKPDTTGSVSWQALRNGRSVICYCLWLHHNTFCFILWIILNWYIFKNIKIHILCTSFRSRPTFLYLFYYDSPLYSLTCISLINNKLHCFRFFMFIWFILIQYPSCIISDFRLPPPGRWEICPYGLLRSEKW